MAGDIEVEVAHTVPLLLAGRRGASPRIGATNVVTRAAIPTVPPAEFADRRTIACYEFALRDGRLWRPVEGYRPEMPRSARPHPAPLALALDALRDPDPQDKTLGDVRREFHHVHVQPNHVRNQYGQLGPWPNLLAPDDPKLETLHLDLRAEAAAAIARRLSRDVASDGANLWIAVPPPELFAGEKPEIKFKASPTIGYGETTAPCPPDGTELHAAYMQRNRFRDKRMGTYPKRLKALGDALLRDLEGVRLDPLHEVDLFVRRLTPIAYQIIDGPFMHGEHREPMRAVLGDLMPLFVRAAVGLVPPERLGDAVDRLHAAAATAIATVPQRGWALGAANLGHIMQYVEEVARPRLASRPVDALDADALGALSR